MRNINGDRAPPEVLQLGKTTLLAVGTGSAIASICVLGIVAVQHSAPGIWSVVAIAAAFVICRVLAGVFAELVRVVPSGAGMFAFTARAWGPAAGMFFIAPYVTLMIFLGATESLIVGHLLHKTLTLPATWIALAFLTISWLICVMGFRLGFGVQALATGLLVMGILVWCAWVFWQVDTRSDWALVATRLWVAPPTLAASASAVGQALFLFMGFELVILHVESTRAARIAWALKATLVLLAVVYAIALIALNLSGSGNNIVWGAGEFLPSFNAPPGSETRTSTYAAIALCLLASITSLNGSFMGLSRLVAAMGSQGVLPRAFAVIHLPSRAPRRALGALLSACGFCVVVIDYFNIYRAVILAAAFAASSLYALALLNRERPPFRQVREGPMSRTRAIEFATNRVMVALLAGIGVGVLVDAGDSAIAVAILIGIAYAGGMLAALRLRSQLRRQRAATPPQMFEMTKAGKT